MASSVQLDVHEITTCTRYAREHLKMHWNTFFMKAGMSSSPVYRAFVSGCEGPRHVAEFA